ncbi:MAG: ABC transporter substrate-binding protein [Chloroflexi bacterium]|nr:ABC transporter substrate-binding protein [Chloroflexota bacterium]
MDRARLVSFGLVVTSALLVSLLVACAAAPTPTPTSAPAPTKAPAAAPTKAAAPTVAAEATKAAPAPTKAAVAPKPAAASVKFGVDPVGRSSDAGYFIARERGYFKEQNIQVEELGITQAPQMVQLLATNEIEAGGGSISPALFNAIGRGIPLKVVADKASVSPGMGYIALVVRKDLWDSGAIRKVEDLKGKNVTLNAGKGGAANHVEVDLLLQTVGLSIKDINIVDLGFADMNAAFAGKSVDAGFPMEPLLTMGLEQGLYVRWKGSDEIYPNHQVAVSIYSGKFAQERTEVAKRFYNAYLKGVRDYNDAFVKKDPKARQEVIDILMKNTSLKQRDQYDKLIFPGLNPDGYANAESIAKDQDWYAANGYLPQKVDLKDVIDNQFADYAVQTLGKYKK